MRVLFATGSPARYMAPPILGDEQVNCGPDWPDEKDGNGRWRSFRTPVGEYDLGRMAARLPREQWPDVVVCLVDASWRNRPKGLGAFRCPCVLLVADTHHLQSPLLGMLRYATAEPFTRTVLLYDRHHAAIFRAAGIKQLFWFPGLTFPHGDAAVRASRTDSGPRAARIRFVGQTGGIHPRRARLLAALTAGKLPIEIVTALQADALRVYGSALAGFNASLNSDLNLRVFEVLAAGAALLTDQLSPAAGLTEFLHEGREVLTYDSAEALVERATWLLQDPARAAAIGAAGARWFDDHFNEAKRRAAFASLAFDGTEPTLFPLRATGTRSLFDGEVDRLVRSVMVYEGLQELHRVQESVRVAVAPNVPSDVVELCRTLPRIECVPDGPDVPADLAVMSRQDATVPAALAERLWCWDAAVEQDRALADRITALGYVPLHSSLSLYARAKIAPRVSPGPLTAGPGPR